jgi:hypothetical protein
MKGGKTQTLNINEALCMIQPEKHIFYSMREGIPYTIESLADGQINNYIRIIKQYTSQDLMPWAYMGAERHLPKISDEYKNDYSKHYIALIYTKILRRETENYKRKEIQ